jgi:adenylylsulfate kinase
MIAWLTGRPAAGKSTLARRARELAGKPVVILDSDEVRDALHAHGYDPPARDAFYRTLGELALMLERQGLPVLVAATAPLRSYRDRARERANEFLEVFVRASVDEAAARDSKGLYTRSDAAANLPGIGAAYEEPRDPELVADGGLDESAARALAARL